MVIRFLPPVILLLTLVPAAAQNVGDQSMARYTSGRTSLNSDAGTLTPPLLPTDMVELTGFDSADSLTVFGDFFLVGQGGSPTRYTLFERDGTEVWTQTITSLDVPLDYGPAFANDIVLLGAPGTSTVKAVRVSDGVELWSNSTIGSSQGRHPLIFDNIAYFHGRDRVVAANATTGTIIWQQIPGTTAQAPLAISGNRAFVAGSLTAYSVRTGGILWGQATAFGGDGSDLIATEGLVFQTDTATGALQASSAVTGAVLWTDDVGTFGDPGIALAYDRLYAFFSDDDGIPCIRAYNPDTGEVLWQRMDPSAREDGTGTIRFATIANNVIHFYNDSGEGQVGRLRAVDAFSGNPMWSLRIVDRMRALSVADGKVFALFDESIQTYEQAYQIYFPQIANGIVISTLVTVNNLDSEEANGMIEFFTSDAQLLVLPTEDGDGASFPLTIPGNESTRLQSIALPSDPAVEVGWARVTMDRPVNGTAIFQINDGTTFTFEAGVGDSPPTGLASVFAATATIGGFGFDTGVAFANVLDEEAVVNVEFRPADGGPALVADPIELGTGNQLARFLTELFPGIDPDDATGTLVIHSDIPVVVTALRTKNGFPFSSYPVGQRP